MFPVSTCRYWIEPLQIASSAWRMISKKNDAWGTYSAAPPALPSWVCDREEIHNSHQTNENSIREGYARSIVTLTDTSQYLRPASGSAINKPGQLVSRFVCSDATTTDLRWGSFFRGRRRYTLSIWSRWNASLWNRTRQCDPLCHEDACLPQPRQAEERR